MIKLNNADMRQSHFDDVNFSASRFHNINFSQTTFSHLNMSDVVIEDACLAGVAIRDCRGLESMTIEGIAVSELLAAWRKGQVG